MRTMIAAAMLCALLAAMAPLRAQGAPVAQWRLDTDADGDGVADGWTARCEAGGGVCTLATDPAGAVVQQVTGAHSGDRIGREATGLDAQATYLVVAAVTVTRGGIVWGPEGVRQKYLAAYSRPAESRVTFSGRDAITIVFAAQDSDTAFSVKNVRLERIEKSPVPVETDTGRFLVPRPRRIQYQPGETTGCLLEGGTRIGLAGLRPEGVNLELFRQDLGLGGSGTVVGPGELSGAAAPGLLIGTPDALRAQLQALPPALGAAVKGSPATLPEEGYYLSVGPDGIVLVAASEAAAQYGLQTLRQLCAPSGGGRWRVRKLTIEDSPALPFRGTYQYGVSATPERLERAKYYARLKLNAVVMEDELLYHLGEGDNLARARDYFAVLRSLHLEPIPLVQSFGWGMYVLAIDPQCVEARYVEGRPMRFATRDAVVPEARGLVPDDRREYLVSPSLLTALANAVRNASFEQLADGRPTDWQADRWADTDGATVSDAAPVTGARCLRLNRQTRGTIRVYQDLEVPENQDVLFTVRLKLQGISGTGAYAEIYRTTEGHELVGDPVVMTPRVTGTRDWELHRMILDSGKHRWYRIYLRIEDAVGTAWFDDLQMGSAGTDLRNLVHAEDSLRLTDEAGTAFVSGRDYEVLPGETRFPFTIDAAPWWIARLPGGRIPPGAEVRLTYEYAPVGAATYCPSDPRTQAIMRDTLGTVVRELGVKRVHIGHDEPRWMNTCRRCRERHLTNAQLLADELTRMREYATAADPQVRVMMWADALNPYHNAPAQQLEPANDATPKDIIECTWFYSAGDDVAEARSLAYMAARGYETTGSPWYDLENNWDWAQECNLSRLMTGKCLGMLYTSWGDNPNADPWAGLSVTAAFSWNPDDPPALEMLPWSPTEMNRTHGLLP